MLSETADDAAGSVSAHAATLAEWELLTPADLSTVDRSEARLSPAACVVATNPNGGQCPSGFACLYQNSNRGGFGVGISAGCGISNLSSVGCPSCTRGNFNDQMSSWQNVSGQRYCWWFDAGPSGEVHTMGNGVTQNVLARENDQASAFGPC